MFIYLIIFALSLLLVSFSEKFKPKTLIHILLVFTALAMPTLLAGLRASSIGTDSWYEFFLIFGSMLVTSSVKV